MPAKKNEPIPGIHEALIVLPCEDLATTLQFFMERLGFRLHSITPADNPRCARISGHGLALELRRGFDGPAGTLSLLVDQLDEALIAPNGTRIEQAAFGSALKLPPLRQALVVCHANDSNPWITGRAGMQYRELIPGRLGGRFVASQIRIEKGGPVPDLVHFHSVRLQLIYCLSGWVEVAYQDQGAALLLQPGDCFLQPPGIRHRVLRCSNALNVLELSCPAEHDTHFDYELELPTPRRTSTPEIGGQHFVHHLANKTAWCWTETQGWETRNTGIAEATHGLAEVRELRCRNVASQYNMQHEGELLFVYVLRGNARLEVAGHIKHQLNSGASVAIPANSMAKIKSESTDLELLEVRVSTQASNRSASRYFT